MTTDLEAIKSVFLVTRLTDDNWGSNQDEVELVTDSFETGVKIIKDKWMPPYIVEWETLPDGLVGHFAYVPHYSVQHDMQFSIVEWEISVIGE